MGTGQIISFCHGARFDKRIDIHKATAIASDSLMHAKNCDNVVSDYLSEVTRKKTVFICDD